MGSVSKVTLFDKDVVILIIFGLRGFNHEGKVAACLKCGYDIRQACCALDGIVSVSVGVTTGEFHCERLPSQCVTTVLCSLASRHILTMAAFNY